MPADAFYEWKGDRGRASSSGSLKRMRKLRDDGLPLRTIAERMQTLGGISISHMGVKTALRGMVR
jgi:hypothetical protein